MKTSSKSFHCHVLYIFFFTLGHALMHFSYNYDEIERIMFIIAYYLT